MHVTHTCIDRWNIAQIQYRPSSISRRNISKNFKLHGNFFFTFGFFFFFLNSFSLKKIEKKMIYMIRNYPKFVLTSLIYRIKSNLKTNENWMENGWKTHGNILHTQHTCMYLYIVRIMDVYWYKRTLLIYNSMCAFRKKASETF